MCFDFFVGDFLMILIFLFPHKLEKKTKKQESKFRETGMLTPEEFVMAGDHLVHHCPSWEWATGDESKIRNILPHG